MTQRMDRAAFFAYIDGLPEAQRLELYEHPEKVAVLAKQCLYAKTWNGLFGHLLVWNCNFNEINFPLRDEGDEAEELCFDYSIYGFDVSKELSGREPASLGAQGWYIKAHPRTPYNEPLVGIGAKWKETKKSVWFPVFKCIDCVRPDVTLYRTSDKFAPGYSFLVRKVKAV